MANSRSRVGKVQNNCWGKKARKCSNTNNYVSNEHRNWFGRVFIVQIWCNLSIKERGKRVSLQQSDLEVNQISWHYVTFKRKVTGGTCYLCSIFFFWILFYLFFVYSKFLLVLYFIHISVYMSIPISQFIPPPPPPPPPPAFPTWCPYVCSLHLCLYFLCSILDKNV